MTPWTVDTASDLAALYRLIKAMSNIFICIVSLISKGVLFALYGDEMHPQCFLSVFEIIIRLKNYQQTTLTIIQCVQCLWGNQRVVHSNLVVIYKSKQNYWSKCFTDINTHNGTHILGIFKCFTYIHNDELENT